MAKRSSKNSVPAKPRRTSSMQKCVADAQDFLKTRKDKKIVKTRTMARTLQQGKLLLAPKGIAQRATKPKAANRPTKRTAVPSKAARSSLPALPSPASLPPPPTTAATIIRARSIDKSIKPSKATVFKTKSKDNLPLPAFGFIDICFCVDSTGSMGSELAQVQSTIVAIIERIQNKVRTQGITLRFSVVAYRDHMDAPVVQHQDFTDAVDTIAYVKKLRAFGGGDQPEAAHDGLLDACKSLNWVEMAGTPMLRYIFHVLDAPPHGKEFTSYQAKNGCTCGKTTDEVVHQINKRQIHYRMIKVRNNPRVDKAEQILKDRLVDFASVDIVQASQMDIRVSDMIIHEIMPQA